VIWQHCKEGYLQFFAGRTTLECVSQHHGKGYETHSRPLFNTLRAHPPSRFDSYTPYLEYYMFMISLWRQTFTIYSKLSMQLDVLSIYNWGSLSSQTQTKIPNSRAWELRLQGRLSHCFLEMFRLGASINHSRLCLKGSAASTHHVKWYCVVYHAVMMALRRRERGKFSDP